jgi:predicted nucleotidyltransferase
MAVPARDVLFSKTQQRVLEALFSGAAPEGLSYAELLRRSSGGAGAIHRELKQFFSAGLVMEKRIGGQRLFLPDPRHPVHDELRSLARKLLGAPAVLRAALSAFEREIEQAYVFGSVARSAERPDSDLDLLVVGTCDYAALLRALQPAEATLGRHISVRLYGPREHRELMRSDRFLAAVDKGRKLWIFEPRAQTRRGARARR